MLKGLAGVTTHETRVGIEIVDNSQDTAALSAWISERIQDRQHPLRHGFLIRGHGLYTWGRDLDEARRHGAHEYSLLCWDPRDVRTEAAPVTP